ncbi:MAG: aminopeptidase P family protein [Gammaproteobacteria bacterium]|nr:aminopeptidase P family protein [Gammaproteobacteria bacterium]
MTELDWHAERSDLSDLSQLDAPAPADVDLVAVRGYRLSRVREQMRAYDLPVLVLSDAVNIRYATGTRNMQVFTARNAPSRYLLLTEHEAILYEFTGCMHLADGIETITEVRPALTASFVAAGDDIAARERAWAKQIHDVILEKVGKVERIGIERMNGGAALGLASLGYELHDAQAPLERARAIKSTEEMKCVIASLRATEYGVAKLRAAIRPGLSEQALWSVLHQAVIARGADYVETRLLSAGERTNPWFQETSAALIQPNSLIALDTDVVGCFGYYADFSRTFHAGPDKPSNTQKTLYQVAHEQVHHNMSIIKPGMSFKDYSELAWNIPERYHANRYYLSAHGVGMTGEYPYLYHHADYADAGYDGMIETGMTLCVESYIGEDGGAEGVKLEQQILVTETGIELLSQFPFVEDLLH